MAVSTAAGINVFVGARVNVAVGDGMSVGTSVTVDVGSSVSVGAKVDVIVGVGVAGSGRNGSIVLIFGGNTPGITNGIPNTSRSNKMMKKRI